MSNRNRTLENLQVLMLRNQLEKEYLDGALDAVVQGRPAEAKAYINLIQDLSEGRVSVGMGAGSN